MNSIVHPCPYCPLFRVEEPPPKIVSEFRDDSTMQVTITRAAWELPMVTHWFDDHPDMFQVIFPGIVLVTDAILATAARAQRQLDDRLRTILVPSLGSVAP